MCIRINYISASFSMYVCMHVCIFIFFTIMSHDVVIGPACRCRALRLTSGSCCLISPASCLCSGSGWVLTPATLPLPRDAKHFQLIHFLCTVLAFGFLPSQTRMAIEVFTLMIGPNLHPCSTSWLIYNSPHQE